MSRARLHRSSVVVGVIAAFLLVLLCVPGRVYQWSPGLTSTHAHGWPFVFLRREVSLGTFTATTPMITKSYRDSLDTLPMFGIPWLSAANWRFWESRDLLGNPRREFSPMALTEDVVLLTVLLTAIVILFEFRRRRRASVVSFNLADVFVTLTLACCALGWFALARSSFQREIAAQAKHVDGDDSGFVEEICVAPIWARALVGDRWMPPFLWRAGVIAASADVAQFPALCDHMRTLPYATTLSITGSIFGDDHYPYARLNAVRQLDTLRVGTNPRIDDRDVQELSNLTSLRKLILSQGIATPERIEQLQAALPGCTVVEDLSNL